MALPNELSARAVVAGTSAGDFTVQDVAHAIIDRVHERDEAVRAFAYFDESYLLAQAAALDGATVRGPLHGVPIGVKDVINTKDMPTEHHTPRYAGSRPGVDAACVDTLRGAGALLVGKTVTTEFAATGNGGPTRNPHDPTRTPGGSSSGSGASVADFQATLALGTQTGGSTIRPASFNGVYGWKPTWNSVSREGLKMYSASCDTLGLYARTADDLALLADVFDIDPLESPLPADLDGVRIGLCRSPAWSNALPATQQALSTGAAQLRAAGAIVTDLDLPTMFDGIADAQRVILRREGRAAFLNEYRNTPDLLDSFKAIVENRLELTADQCRDAYRLADQCRGAFDDIAAGFDVILTPSATGEAPVGIAQTGDASFNSMWTILQVPVVSVPGQVGPAGMPVGLSLVSRRYQDRKVIAFASMAGAAFSSALATASR
jgi:amidase